MSKTITVGMGDTAIVINKYKGSDTRSPSRRRSITSLLPGSTQVHLRAIPALKKVILPSSLLGIRDSAFKGCSKLEEVIGLENTQVTELKSYVFSGCKNLKTISLPKTLTTISISVFQSCSSLTSVYGLENTKVTTISNDAFNDCAKLSYIRFPSTLTNLGMNAFYNCGLETVNLSDTKITRISDYCFRGNGDLTTIKLPSTVASVGIGAFLLDKSLVNISFPSSLKTVGERAFAKCYRLNSPNMFKICYGLESIGRWAFLDCTDLKKLFLPASLKTLSQECFGFHIQKYDDLYGGSYEAAEPFDNGNRTVMIYPTATVAKNYYNSYNSKWSSNKNKMYLEMLTCTHSYSNAVTKQPTCTAAGVKTFTCKKCKDSYTETIASAVTLATGSNFPDGLCGGPLGYATNCPLILTAKGRGADANSYVKNKNVKTAWILGGPTIVSEDTVKTVFK